jgi:hypothetical protein
LLPVALRGLSLLVGSNAEITSKQDLEISYGALGKSPWDHDVYLRIGLGALIGALGCTLK